MHQSEFKEFCEKIKQITEMGFAEKDAERALRDSCCKVDAAIERYVYVYMCI